MRAILRIAMSLICSGPAWASRPVRLEDARHPVADIAPSHPLKNRVRRRNIFVWAKYWPGRIRNGGFAMTVEDRIESLKVKHSRLEHEIDAEVHRPLPDGMLIAALKREKLRIKDEIARMDS